MSTVSASTAVKEASSLIREAFPICKHRCLKGAIAAAARKLGLGNYKNDGSRRAKAIWYGEASRIEASEMDALRRAWAKEQMNAAIGNVAGAAIALERFDADKYRHCIDGLRSALAELGADDSAGNASTKR